MDLGRTKGDRAKISFLLLTPDGKKVKNINNVISSKMLKGPIKKAVKEVYPNGDAIGQDDEAVIHRTNLVLETFDSVFKSRVPPNVASKTGDL